MKKYLLAIGLVLILVLAAPVATRAESLNVAQLRAIIASLQAQLNFLIAKLQLQLQQQNGSTTTSSNQLTADKILNSNGFVNGKKQVGQYSSSDLSGIIFGQLDNDSGQEAIAVQTNCGASCGEEIVAFKLVNNAVLMVSLPDSAVSGAAQNIDAMKIGSDGVITFTGTDNFGSKTNYYRVTLVNGVLKAEKTSTVTSYNLPVITQLWTNDPLVIDKNINWGVSVDGPNSGDVFNYKLSCGDGNNGQLVYGEAHLYFVCNYKRTGTYKVLVTVSNKSGLSVTRETTAQIIDSPTTPSLKATLNVTALNGAIQCFRAPCEFPLSGAQVTVYDANKALVGNQIVGSNGIATFSNLNPGTYTVYVAASGYTQTNGQTIGLVAGQSASVKIPVFLTR